MEIILNPITIIKGVDRNTPLFVLTFLDAYYSLGFNPKYAALESYVNEFKDKINHIKPKKILFPLTVPEKKILNPSDNSEWNLESVNIGYESYFPFLNENLNLDELPQKIGSKTNADPESINELMIYRICKEISYPTTLNSSLNELAFAVSNFLSGDIPKMRHALMESIKTIPDSQVLMFSFLAEKTYLERKIEKSSERYVDNCEMISLTNLCIQDANYLLKRVVPTSHAEAIILAIKRWNLILIEAENPIFQYNIISKYGIEDYVPINDINFKIKYIANKNWYHYEKNWFPEIFQMYDHGMLTKFAIHEGYQSQSKQKDRILRSFLDDRNKVTNFFFEIVPYSENRITYVERLDISEIENIICVGNISKREFIYFSVEEFIQYLNYKKHLIDPISEDLFDNISINKLKMHCNEMVKMRKNRHIFSELLRIILELEQAVSLATIKVKEIFIFKNELLPIFRGVQELGLIMRGRVVDEIPVSSIDSMVPEDRLGCVFHRSFDYFKQLCVKIEQLQPDVKEIFKNIKIVKFTQNGTRIEIFGETLRAPNIEYSISLCDCMNGVFYGEYDERNCFRTNSNWILYTSSWYIKMLGEPLEYKMEEIGELG